MLSPLIELKTTRAYLEERQEELKSRVKEAREEMNDAALRNGLSFILPDKTLPTPVSLGTVFMEEKRLYEAEADLRHILNAVIKVRRAYFDGNPDIRHTLLLPKAEATLIHAENPRDDSFGVLRFDGYPTERGFMLTEINSDNPGVISVLTSFWKSAAPLLISSDFGKRLLNTPNLSDELIESVKERFSPNKIGLLMPMNYPSSEWRWEQRAFEQAGIKTVIGTTSEISFENGVLKIAGEQVDAIRRIAEIGQYTRSAKEVKPLLKALSTGTARCFNGFGDRLLGYKTTFAILTDPKYRSMFTEDEVNAINEHIPWTRLLTPEAADEAMSRHSQLVIKPAGETRSRGVTVGPEVSERDWQSALMSAAFDPKQWVVQAVVPALKTPVLEDHGNTVSIEDRYVDFSAMVFWRKEKPVFLPAFSGYNARLISSVSNGSKLLLPFFLKDETTV
ncbi:MAG: circularly permuted type 2 ATP-grasp protein [Patescibacteria group bacterium]